MKNGFTLIELLGVMALLGIIILVAVPSLIASSKRAQINQNANYNDIIVTACTDYANVEGITNGTVTIKTLIDSGYLKDGSIKNADKARELTVKVVAGEIKCVYKQGG